MIIVVKIKNKFGDFKSVPVEIDEDDYQKVTELSKEFYVTGYDMETTEGFVVIPPDVIRESILIIEKQ